MTTEQQRILNLEKEIEQLKNKPLSVIGIVRFIDPAKDVSKTEGKTFFTRNLCLDTSVDINGTRYESFVGFQMTGDKCNLLDNVNIGDKIEVMFSIKATVKASDKDIKSDKNPKGELCFSNLTAYNINVISKVSVSTGADAAPAAAETEAAKPVVKNDLPF